MNATGSVRRHPLLVLLALGAQLAGFCTIAQPAAARTDAAGRQVTWGSIAELDARSTVAPIVSVRAGRHACFDRLVIEVRSTPQPGYRIRYVDRVVSDGSGAVVPVRGGARMQISVLAPTYDPVGHPTYRPGSSAEAVPVAGFRMFRQVAFAGSFEGTSTFGLGFRARLPFRVFVLAGPAGHARLVIDVAHSWV